MDFEESDEIGRKGSDLRHLLDGGTTSGNLNKIGGNKGLAKLVEDDGELSLELLAVLVGTIHSVTARKSLSGRGLVVGVVSGSSKGELAEVLEEVLLAFFEVEGELSGLLDHLLLRRDEDAGNLESVVGDELVEDKHDAIVLELRQHLSGAGKVSEGDDLGGVDRSQDTNVQSGLLLESLIQSKIRGSYTMGQSGCKATKSGAKWARGHK